MTPSLIPSTQLHKQPYVAPDYKQGILSSTISASDITNPWTCLHKFSYYNSHFEWFQEPPLTTHEIRSIFLHSFLHHYILYLIDTNNYIQSTDYFTNTINITRIFDDIFNWEPNEHAPDIPPSGTYPLHIPIEYPLFHCLIFPPRFSMAKWKFHCTTNSWYDMWLLPSPSSLGGISLATINNLPDITTFVPTTLATNSTLFWNVMPTWSLYLNTRASHSALCHHVSKFLTYEF